MSTNAYILRIGVGVQRRKVAHVVALAAAGKRFGDLFVQVCAAALAGAAASTYASTDQRAAEILDGFDAKALLKCAVDWTDGRAAPGSKSGSLELLPNQEEMR